MSGKQVPPDGAVPVVRFGRNRLEVSRQDPKRPLQEDGVSGAVRQKISATGPFAGPVPASPKVPHTGSPDRNAELQATVAEAVRRELRGELGERITRSVRMLVRRELRRAQEERGA
ncbi:hypothetical protein [Tropicimonas sp.]|uniref:hypothetical protein n=1 Tax=Tropicimonas sp. TaxID=2067044 RepID=UPI003A8B55B9